MARAGARTSRSFGEAPELLGKYAWFLRNSQDHSWPVGSKKPNDLGFFDLHGNVWNWCQERYQPYPSAATTPMLDEEDSLEINNAADRVMRGGSYYAMPPSVRAAYRANPGRPTIRLLNAGFRPARPIP